MRIVINSCHGGFGLSEVAEIRYKEHYNITDPYWYAVTDICRADPYLIELIEEMGYEAEGKYAKLKIVEIPDGVEWQIQEYDGMEWVAEKHRTWS
jgi:hypothetical protein